MSRESFLPETEGRIGSFHSSLFGRVAHPFFPGFSIPDHAVGRVAPGIANYKDNTRNQTFTYDALNRLASARNAGTDCIATVLGGLKKFWGNNYTYDAWGI
jgi:hypothetical protein